MNLAQIFLDNKTASYACLLFALILGLFTLNKLPIQLTPEVQKPEVSITTAWRAATPNEIESEIIEPQEDVLKGLPGVTRMVSTSGHGSGSIRLTFELGFSLDRALIEIINRLNSVPSYPIDADNPVLSNVGETARPIAWFIIRPAPGNNNDIDTYKTLIEEEVQRRFEQVRGVALSEVLGAMESELRITIDPYKAAARGIILPTIANQIAGLEDISAGDKDIGKRGYSIRFHGAYKPQELGGMVLAWRNNKPVRLRDISTVAIVPQERNSFVITKDGQSIAVNAYRESGVNVISIMNQLKSVAAKLSEGILADSKLTIEQVYDETDYIRESISLLLGNLVIGIILAGFALWWFTRRLRPMLVVGMSIPLSLFAALIVLELSGRTLNTISLAALALSVGMVLDASIIVVENILRLRTLGHSLKKAALQGIVQTRAALIASSATTVAIFLPIVWLEGEAGQLFADLALALSVAITVSLLTALFLVPSFSNMWLDDKPLIDPFINTWKKISDGVLRLTDGQRKRHGLIALLISIPLIIIVLTIPKADYLPTGNRNLVFAILLPPPGMNITTLQEEVGNVISDKLSKYVKGDAFPKIKHYFFVAFPGQAFMGARASNADESGALVPVLNNLLKDFPGILAFAQRASLFSDRNSRSIEINIQGNDIQALLNSARAGFIAVKQVLPFAQTRPRPGLELSDPQLSLLPKEERIAEVGWGRREVGFIARAAGDGLFAVDYFDGKKTINTIVLIEDWQSIEDLAALPVATPSGGTVPLGALVDIQRVSGPDRIRRVDRLRTVTLEVTAPPQLSLQETLDALKEKVEPVIRAQLPASASISYGGSADKLESLLKDMGGTFGLALIILYLLISVLFHSFRDGLLIMISLPLAVVGSVSLLHIVNLLAFQTLDLLTMIGFIIMLGMVVNNAILLVHQTRIAERQGICRRDAVEQALLVRLRPIAISTITSLLGMLPLLLALGAGAELYRGLATVIVGGLMVSTIFTLVLLPALLRLGEDSQ